MDFPAANKLLIHIMAAVAEHERLLISQRTKAALAAAKARGVQLGANGRCSAERHKSAARAFAETLRQPVTAALQGGPLTLQRVADELNRGGHRSREGAPWSPAGVKRLLDRLGFAASANDYARPALRRSVPEPASD